MKTFQHIISKHTELETIWRKYYLHIGMKKVMVIKNVMRLLGAVLW